MDHDILDLIKLAIACASVVSGIGTIGLFVIRSLIRTNNDKLLDRFNSRYLKRELYEERDKALNQKLDLIHAFQHEKHEYEKNRLDEVADLCQAVKVEQEQQNVRLSVIEARTRSKP